MKINKIILMIGLAIVSLQSFAQKNENKKVNCGSFFKIDQGNVLVKENDKGIHLDFDYTLTNNSDITSSIDVWVTIKDCKGNEKQVLSTLKYNTITKNWSNNLTITNNKECPWQLLSFNLDLTNNCGDTFSTDTMLFTELKNTKNANNSNHRTKKRFNPNLQTKNTNNENHKDSCDFNNFTISDETIVINNEKSALGLYLALKLSEKKGLASKAYILLEIENCKGEIQYVKVDLVYDAKTALWVGKQAIIQNLDCNWKINSYEYVIHNACDDEYVSETFETGTIKNNGTLPARDRIVARRRRSN